MSPSIFIFPTIVPNSRRFLAGDGGTTSATGLPRRVMRRGFLVLLTSSSKERHLALNSEMAISCIKSSHICNTHYSHSRWSNGRKHSHHSNQRFSGACRLCRSQLHPTHQFFLAPVNADIGEPA